MTCPGPLISLSVPGADGEEVDAVLTCASCDYTAVGDSVTDEAHVATPLLRDGGGA